MNNSSIHLPGKILNSLPISFDGLVLIPADATEKRPFLFTLALAIEIRNPLTSISMAAEILQSTTEADEKNTCLDIISRNALRINELVKKLIESYNAEEVLFEINNFKQLKDLPLLLTEDSYVITKSL